MPAAKPNERREATTPTGSGHNVYLEDGPDFQQRPQDNKLPYGVCALKV